MNLLPTRLLLTGALLLLLAGCAAWAPQAPPRLVVLVVIDGLPQRQMEALRDQWAADGFARFLREGRVYENAQHAHAYTVTAAGHASFLTGAEPQRTGIIGNEWRDPASGERVYNSGDTGATYIGHETRPLDGTSPRNLLVESLGDILRRADARSKVIGIAGKDRGAILLAGRDGTAYMYMQDSGQFASSTYYMQRHPAWVDAFNAAKPADRFFGTEWQPLLPPPAYARSLPDGQPWSAAGGRLPMPLGDGSAPGPAFYASLMHTPVVDALTLDFARAAVAGEALGQDDAPDVLAISLSAHDVINHLWSAESRLSQDHLLRLDRMLQDFFADLDRRVGRDRYLAVLTSDHGFMPPPELARAQGRPAGRLVGTAMLAAVNEQLERRFGVPRLVAFGSASGLVLDRALLARHGLAPGAVAAAARDALLAQDGFAAAYTREELESGSRTGAPYFELVRRSWHPLRSGDVQYVLQPDWMFGTAAATHGSPHAYDTHVPLMLWGPRWVAAGRAQEFAPVVNLAPTLARIVHVPPPSASQGIALRLTGK